MADQDEPAGGGPQPAQPGDDAEGPTRFTRRDFVKVAGALGLASAGGAAAWGALEAAIAKGPPTHWHKSVCRYCGT
ncbi:MAG TPA: hypothetical protein VFZ61_20990, partial [Polyangiales bacterium]